MKKLLLTFQQVGGVNALLPIIEEWCGYFDVIITGRNIVTANLKRRGINALTYEELGIKTGSISSAPEWFEKISPDIVITDTIDLTRTHDGIACRDFWILAARYRIPSIAYVDCWWGYRSRFQLPGEVKPPILPKHIAVIDELAKKDIIFAGLPADRIVILGSPKLEYLLSISSAQNRSKLKKERGLYKDCFVVVFVSQPINKKLCFNNKMRTEKKSLLMLISVLIKCYKNTRCKIKLIILPHPEENIEDFEYINDIIFFGINIEINKNNDSYKLIIMSDIVVGISSIMLAEAAVMKVPVISLQIDNNCKDVLITNVIGATLSVNSYEQLYYNMLMAIKNCNFIKHLIQRQSGFKIICDSSLRWNEFVCNCISTKFNYENTDFINSGKI